MWSEGSQARRLEPEAHVRSDSSRLSGYSGGGGLRPNPETADSLGQCNRGTLLAIGSLSLRLPERGRRRDSSGCAKGRVVALLGVSVVVAGLDVVLGTDGVSDALRRTGWFGRRGRLWPSRRRLRRVTRSSTLGKLPASSRASASVRRWEQGASDARVKRRGMLTVTMPMLMLIVLLLLLL